MACADWLEYSKELLTGSTLQIIRREIREEIENKAVCFYYSMCFLKTHNLE